MKGQGKRVLNLEADLLETAKRASKKAKLETTMTYKDQDEKVLRDKLVNRLKEKEVLKMEHFGERLKNAKENNYLDSSDDGVEDISDDDLDQVIVRDFIVYTCTNDNNLVLKMQYDYMNSMLNSQI